MESETSKPFDLWGSSSMRVTTAHAVVQANSLKRAGGETVLTRARYLTSWGERSANFSLPTSGAVQIRPVGDSG